jgi:5'-nucleotidase
VAILVTNDDGIDGPGLHALARAVHAAGHDVVVAAPDRNMSGAGASVGHLGQDSRIGLRPVPLPDLDVPAYAVDGPPGLIVLLARLGGLGEGITGVASGINPGWNTGRSVLHSGTVGAVLTGAQGGWSGVAVSSGDQPTHWDTAADLAVAALDWVLAEPPGTVVNLNVPDLPRHLLKGVEWGRLGNPPAVKTSIVGDGEGFVRLNLEVADEPDGGSGPDEHTDTGLVQRGFVSATLLHSVSEAPRRPIHDHLRGHPAAGPAQ